MEYERIGDFMKTILPHSSNYGGVRTKTQYIVIHYTASAGGTAEANGKYFQTANRGASAHYFVGLNGEIVSSVPENYTAWHCGASKYKHKEARNSNSIGVELCCNKLSLATKNATDKDWYFTVETINSACQFVAELMKKYNINIDHVIRHYDVTGKICPAPFVHNELQWELFLETCDKLAKAKQVTPVATYVPDIKPAVEPKPVNDSSFKVRLKEEMNIRKGAGTIYAKVGVAPKGVYTITETNLLKTWGKLKSGAGWVNISAKYAERL